MGSACPRCISRGQTWPGDPPKCAFEDGAFSEDNWMCATALAIREAVAGEAFGPPPAGVSKAHAGDQAAVLVPIDLDDCPGHFLLVSWYKRRGRVDVLAIVGDDDLGVVRLPLEHAEEVIEYLERNLHGVVPTPPELRS